MIRGMAVESTALVLTERLDALAAALRAAGVPPEQSASLLASAASATMHALTLDALLDEQAMPVARPAPVAEPGPALRRVPLAA
jgi:non-ribosomal peptide synthetase component F